MKSVYDFFLKSTKRKTSTDSHDSTLTDLPRLSDCSNISADTTEIFSYAQSSDFEMPAEFIQSLNIFLNGSINLRILAMDSLLLNVREKDLRHRRVIVEATLNVLIHTMPSQPYLIHNRSTLFHEIHRMQVMGDFFIKCCKALGLLIKPSDPLDLRKKAVVALLHSTYFGSQVFLTDESNMQWRYEQQKTYFHRIKKQISTPPHNGVLRAMDKEACETLTSYLCVWDPSEFRQFIIKGLCVNSGYDCGIPYSASASMCLRDICSKDPIFFEDVLQVFQKNPNVDARKESGNQFIAMMDQYQPKLARLG